MKTGFVFAATLFAGLCASASNIDWVSAAGGAVNNGLGTHDIPNGGAGTWGVKAHAYDSAGTQGVDDPAGGGTITGVYTPSGSGKAGPVTDTGTYLKADALAQITWNTTQWSSGEDLTNTGLGGSYATVTSVGPEPYAGDEVANSKAGVHDPRVYTETFAPNTLPEVDFMLQIGAGAQLTSLSGIGLSTSSSLSGDYQTDLLPGNLFSFSWSADSAHPGSSIFHFSSNSALGLNDSLLQSQFASLLTDAGGIHTLTADFTINAAYFPTLPPGVNTLTFSLGGDTEYDAAGAVSGTPEPGTLALMGLALIALSFLGRRIGASRF
jgi:hypothetical protein